MDEDLTRAAKEGDESFLEEAVNREISSCGNFQYFLKKFRGGNNILHLAVRNGRGEWIKKAIELLPRHVIKELIFGVDVKSNNPLHESVTCNINELIEAIVKGELFSREVSYDILTRKTGNECTLIHLAAEEGNMEILKLLLDYLSEGRQSEIETVLEEKNIDGETALHYAVFEDNNVEMVKYLMQNHPRLAHISHAKNGTPLHYATHNGMLRIVQQFDEFGDDEMWEIKNAEGNTPLHYAAMNGQFHVVKFLVEKHSHLAFLTNKMVKTPLDVASDSTGLQTELADIFLEQPQQLRKAVHDAGDTVIQLAVIHGYAVIVESLLNHKPELIRIVNSKNQMLLHLAINYHESTRVDKNALKEGYYVPRIIKFLVQKDSSVACMRDAEGFTPLHRATCLCTTYNVHVVEFIIQHCSQSAGVLDNFGQTVLHMIIDRISSYEQGKKLLSIPEIYALRDIVDKQGKLPIDIAWEKNYAIAIQCFPMESHQLPFRNEFEIMEKRRMIMEEYGAIQSASIIMKKLHKYGMNFVLSQYSNKRNILHILLHIDKPITIPREDYVHLVHEILVRYPWLICQVDDNGDTPVHILVRNPPNIQFCYNSNEFYQISMEETDLLFELLEKCRQFFYKARASVEGIYFDPPWLMQNIAGNTPLHEALIANCELYVVELLYKFDIELAARLINKKKEAPLHLLAGGKLSNEGSKNYDAVTKLFGKYEEAVKMKDQDGLYPHQRAFRVGNINEGGLLFHSMKNIDIGDISVFHLIINYKIIPDSIGYFLEQKDFIESLRKQDKNGKTPLHLLIEHGNYKLILQIIKFIADEKEYWEILKIKDNDGNSPLHLIILRGNYKFVGDILEFIDGEQKEYWDIMKIQDNDGNTPLHLLILSRKFMFVLDIIKLLVNNDLDVKHLLEMENKEGITVGALIGSREELPKQLEDFLIKEPKLVGIRSVYGIVVTEMKDYVNTMGVIAALLTTISFTAAFTVPGGLNQTGTPLLVKSASFQTFMVFDVLTMCLSIMVLFCLMWIMATNNKRKSVMLLDFSIWLLQLSFYTTLLTFMTGVYATNIHDKQWIAIYTLVLSSLLMVFMHKYILVELLGPCMVKFLLSIRLCYPKLSFYRGFNDPCKRFLASFIKVFVMIAEFFKNVFYTLRKKILKSKEKRNPIGV